jgi:glycolate oxidase iron-sulfur subunit
MSFLSEKAPPAAQRFPLLSPNPEKIKERRENLAENATGSARLEFDNWACDGIAWAKWMFRFLPPRFRLKLMPQNNVAPAFNSDLAASLRAEMERCAKCGQCRSVCPVFIETGDEAGVARGRISLAEALLDGRIGYAKRLQESFTKCLDCLRCDSDCPSGVAHELVLQAVRQGIARDIGAPWLARFALRHLLPRPRLFEMALRLVAGIRGPGPESQRPPVRHLPLFLAPGARIPQLAAKSARRQFREMSAEKTSSQSSKGRVAIFTGCLINAVYPEVATDLAVVLDRIGYEPVLPQAQTCCSAPLLNFGEVATARRVAEVNRRALAESGAETVLTPCAACGHTLKSTYSRLLSPDWTGGKFRILDATEFLARAELGQLAPLAKRVAYHDPCQLRWGQKITEQPRDLLQRCARYVEMPGAERCCGGGGAFSLFHPEIAAKIIERKVRSVRESGAEVVATACPGCMLLLSAHLPEPPLHVIQVLRRAMGL